jgi:hypothetical protein
MPSEFDPNFSAPRMVDAAETSAVAAERQAYAAESMAKAAERQTAAAESTASSTRRSAYYLLASVIVIAITSSLSAFFAYLAWRYPHIPR